uniref:Uncharacterized protein n=1 Tax=Arundo donax TaxID=35708 RepID=A0A0A8YPY4_ARUDO
MTMLLISFMRMEFL